MPDGTTVLLVVLHDDRCAVLRANQVVLEAAGDADGIDGAVRTFMALTHVPVADAGDGAAYSQETPTKSATTQAPATSATPATASTPAPPAPALPRELSRLNDAAIVPTPPATPRTSA